MKTVVIARKIEGQIEPPHGMGNPTLFFYNLYVFFVFKPDLRADRCGCLVVYGG